MNRHSIFALILFAVAALSVACEGVLEQEQGNLQITLALEGDSLEVVDRAGVESLTNPPAEHAAIHFVFEPSDGSPSVQGEVADTRLVRSEFDADGNPDPQEVMLNAGLIEVRVPWATGRLVLRSPEGEVLGEVEIDPEAPLTQRAALMSEDDIVSNPVKIVSHGTSEEKMDILFLPEGYKEGDMASFHQHVSSITRQLAREPGYKEHWEGFNVLRWDVRSNTRGTGSNGRPTDTAFETASGVSGLQRCVFFANSRGMQAARNLGRRVGADVTVVLVNSTMHGGCARDGVVVSSRPSHVAEIVAHEIAHGLFGLADEYESQRTSGYCSTGPNVARSVQSLPWADMVNTSSLPTPRNASRGTIGAFEGAGYCSRGRYRPTHDCMMRSLGADMCPVCRHVVAETMAPYMGASSSGTSSSSTSGSSTSTGGTSSSSSSGSSSSNSSSGISSPSGLTPDLVPVPSTDVPLRWNSVSGATNYKLKVERQSGTSWNSFGNAETTGTTARVTLRGETANYRWSVEACNNSGCARSNHAFFTYDGDSSSSSDTSTSGGSSGGTSSGGTSTSSGVPAVPGNLKPSDATATSDETPSLSWDSVSGAEYYNFKMVHQESQSSWPVYVSAQRVDANRVSTTLRTPERWYGFAVQSCNGSGCSAWTEWSRLYYRP